MNRRHRLVPSMGYDLARTTDGRRIEVSRRVSAPASAVWDLLVDTERWPEWGPTVRAVEASERRVRAGTTGHVRVVGGVRVPFRVDSCRARRWTWRVAGVPATGHRADAVEGDGSRVVLEVPPFAAGYVPVCRVAVEQVRELAERAV